MPFQGNPLGSPPSWGALYYCSIFLNKLCCPQKTKTTTKKPLKKQLAISLTVPCTARRHEVHSHCCATITTARLQAFLGFLRGRPAPIKQEPQGPDLTSCSLATVGRLLTATTWGCVTCWVSVFSSSFSPCLTLDYTSLAPRTNTFTKHEPQATLLTSLKRQQCPKTMGAHSADPFWTRLLQNGARIKMSAGLVTRTTHSVPTEPQRTQRHTNTIY